MWFCISKSPSKSNFKVPAYFPNTSQQVQSRDPVEHPAGALGSSRREYFSRTHTMLWTSHQ